MPELPEVEVLVRHLAPLLKRKRIRGIEIHRAKVLRPTPARQFTRTLSGASFESVSRRGKYLLFRLRARGSSKPLTVLGHLGMTGRMYLLPASSALPTHAAVVFNLGKLNWVFEDTRYFGRLTLDLTPLQALGPEPLNSDFTADYLADALRRSSQAIKVKLLDQRLVAGVGNIYASEALFRAGVSPRKPARRLTRAEVERLQRSIRAVLQEAIEFGSTVPLDWPGATRRDGVFYYGRSADGPDYYAERLRVYDREGQPCLSCGGPIRRIVQAARSTYYCPVCQPAVRSARRAGEIR
jgi:formamidopyrimidine-DNA glycosylase